MAYAKKVMRYLRNSALPILHRIEHKIITLFAKGEWIDNNNVMRRLEVQVTRLSNELMMRAEKGKVSFADTDRIKEEVLQMKAICQKLREAGVNAKNIQVLEGKFEIVLEITTKADEAIVESESKHDKKAHSPKPHSPKSPREDVDDTLEEIINQPSPEPETPSRSRAPTPVIDEEEEYKSAAGSPARPDDVFEDVETTESKSPKRVASPLVSPTSERQLIKDLAEKMAAFFTEAKMLGVFSTDISILRAIGKMDAEEAVVKADRILTVVEKTLVDKGMARWREQPGGDILIKAGHEDLDDAYYELVVAYSKLKDLKFEKA